MYQAERCCEEAIPVTGLGSFDLAAGWLQRPASSEDEAPPKWRQSLQSRFTVASCGSGWDLLSDMVIPVALVTPFDQMLNR
jgi:hypothetical protein